MELRYIQNNDTRNICFVDYRKKKTSNQNNNPSLNKMIKGRDPTLKLL